MRAQRAFVCASAAAVDTSKSPKSQGFTMPGASFATHAIPFQRISTFQRCACAQLSKDTTRPWAMSNACMTALPYIQRTR